MKKSKKVLALLLVAVMLATLVTIPAYAKAPTPITVDGASVTARVEQLNGNQNRLWITVTDKSGTMNQDFMIRNNAEDTYAVSTPAGKYAVYIDTKGNTQIRACYIVSFTSSGGGDAPEVVRYAPYVVVLTADDLGGQPYMLGESLTALSWTAGSDIDAQQAWELDNGLVTIPRTAATETLAAGDIIMLPPCHEYVAGLALKITSVAMSDSVVLHTEAPAFEEIMQGGCIQSQGDMAVDIGSIIISDDLYILIEEMAEAEAMAASPARMSATTRDTPKLGVEDVPGGAKFTFLANMVSFSMTVKNLGVKYKSDIEWDPPTILWPLPIPVWTEIPVSINQLYVEPYADIEFVGDVEFMKLSLKDRFKDEGRELFSFTQALGKTGLAVVVTVRMYVELNGKISVQMATHLSGGAEVVLNKTTQNLRILNNSRWESGNDAYVGLGFVAKVGGGLDFALSLGGILPLLNAEPEAGFAGKGEAKPRTLDEVCADTTAWVYGEVGFLKRAMGAYISKWFHVNATWKIWDENSSPWKWEKHFELYLGEIESVPLCSYNTISGRVVDESGGPIPGAAVTFSRDTTPISFYDSNDNLVDRILTGADGRFEAILRAGTYALNVTSAGYGPASVAGVVSPNEPTDVGDVVLNGGAARITGSVVYYGRPNPEFHVRFYATNSLGTRYYVTLADKNSRFEIELETDGLDLTVDVVFWYEVVTTIVVSPGTTTDIGEIEISIYEP